MKIVNKALAILTAVFALTAVSCNNSVTNENKTPSTYMVATVDNFNNNAARTVLPEIELDSFSSYIIEGSRNGGYTTELARFDSYEAMESTTIPMAAGEWDLYLIASTGDTVFESTLNNVEIVSGRNIVSFNLTMTSFGDYNSDDGGIAFTLNLPEDSDAVKALISLENYSDITTGSEFIDDVKDIENNQVTYLSNEIKPGYYKLSIKLYGDEDCLLYLNTYREIVVVASNLTSSAVRSMNLAEKVYTVNYVNIELEDSLVNYTLATTVTRHSSPITLPTIENLSRNGWTFLGWYTTSNFAEGSEITVIENVTSDLTIYAKWERNYYTITYVNGGDRNNNPANYEFGSEFNFTDPEVPEGNVFLGWYTTPDFQEGTEITGVTSTDCENITIYGKYDFTDYTITYVAFDEVGEIALPDSNNPTIYNFVDEITFEIPVYEGYILKGFYADSEMNTKITGIPVGSIGNRVVYLQYITNRISSSELDSSLAQLGTNSVYELTITDTTPDFEEIKTALDNHKDVKVSLDFSAATDVTEIPNNAFQTVSNVTSIILPDTVTTINSYAFAGTTNLETVVLGSNVTTINSRAFQGATGLKNIEIPSTVEVIGDYAFAGTRGLEITIPDTITTFGNYVFYGSANDVITIPSSYVFIKAPSDEKGVNNMLRMSNGNEVIFSDNPSSIPDYAFAGANGIKITIPSSVVSFGQKVFNNTREAEISAYYSTFNNTITSSGSPLFFGASEFTFAFADTVTTIPNYAFYNSDLAHFDIPETVTTIGDYAFARTTITSIELPESLLEIYDYAFADNNNLEITIPLSVKTLAQTAFYGDENLKLGIDVKHINTYRPYSYGTSHYNALLKDITSVAIELIESDTTYIHDFAFNNAPNVTSISIPSTITYIGNYAFSYATGLEELTIPNTVTTLGNYSFYYAGKVMPEGWTLTVPLRLVNEKQGNSSSDGNSLFNSGTTCSTNPFNLILTNPDDEQDWNYATSIQNYALANVKSMKSIVIPENITSIGSYAFYACTGLTEVTIPASINRMYSYAFNSCSNLETLIYESEEIMATGSAAFAGTTKLKTVKVPNMVTWMNWSDKSQENCSPFYGTYQTTISTELYIGDELLTSVSFADDITAVSIGQFFNIDSITTVDINKVERFASYAFYACDGLTEVTIPSTVVSTYGSYIFGQCKNITTIRFLNKEKLNSGNYWFTGCKKIENVYIDNIHVWENKISNNDYYSPFYGTDVTNTKLYVGGSLLKVYSIPKDMTEVPQNMFYKVGCLEKVIFHNDVTNIGTKAFAYCRSLNNVALPNSLVSISQEAFRNCESLTQINLPETVTTIGNYAFSATGITSITIPPLVTSLGQYAFDNCSNITTIIYTNEDILPVGQYAFRSCSSVENIYIPNADVWFNRTSLDFSYSPLYGVNNRNVNLFINGRAADSVTVPDTVTSISKGLFNNLGGIKEIIIPETVTTIGESAFQNCSDLEEIIIPDSVTTIGNYAFMGCSNIKSITIPNSVLSLGSNLFVNCGSNEEGADELVITIPLKLLNSNYYNGSTSYVNYLFGGSSYYNNNEATYCTTKNFRLILTNPEDTSDPNYADSLVRYALAGLTDLKSVTLPDNITSIGYDAFANCKKLESVEIPYGVTSIGEYAFYNCNSLESMEIPNSVQSIGQYAFQYDRKLKTITIPNSVTSLGSHAFMYTGSDEEGADRLVITMPLKLLNERVYTNSSYTNYLFGGGSDSSNSYCQTRNFELILTNPEDTEDPNYVSGMANYALCHATGLKAVTLPENITSIGDYAFYYCNAIDSIEIPSNVTTIGNRAFYYCQNITAVTLPENITSIGEYAFYHCDLVESIEIPGSIQTIGNYAFAYMTNLESAVIGEGSQTIIGNNVFQNDGKLKTITIPNSVTSLGSYAFWYTGSDEEGADRLVITMPLKLLNDNVCSNYSYTNYLFGGNTSSSGGFCQTRNFELILTNPEDTEDPNYASELANYALCMATGLKALTLPDNITSIGKYAFYNCKSIENIEIPSNVTSIGDYAFYHCDLVGSIEIPASVQTIGSYAFEYMTNLESAVIEEGSQASIGEYAFIYDRKLKTITIPNSVTSLGRYAFMYTGSDEEGADRLVITMPLKLLNDNVYSYSSYTNYLFGGTSNSSNSYCQTRNFELILTNPEDTEDPNYTSEMASYALCHATGLKAVTLPDNITSIGNYAFYYCNAIDSIEIPSNVTSIGDYAFYHCDLVGSIEIPASVQTIGSYAFEYMTNLESAVIEEGSQASIGEYAFIYDRKLKTITIPNSVTSLGRYAFMYTGSDEEGADRLVITMPLKLLNDNVYSYSSYTNYLFGGSSNSSNSYCQTRNFELILTNPEDTEDPNYVSGMANYALCRATELKAVTLPDNITGIGNYAFSYCNAIDSIEIPASVQTIGEHVFENMTNLENIVIQEGVQSIGPCAFYNDSKLKAITIPNSVTSLGQNAFTYCGSNSVGADRLVITMPLKLLNDNANTSSSSYNNKLFSSGTTCYTYNFELVLTNPEDITDPNYVSGMANYILSQATELKAVTLPDNITSIGNYAFYNCSSVSCLEFGLNITTVGTNACYNVPYLHNHSQATGEPWGANSYNEGTIIVTTPSTCITHGVAAFTCNKEGCSLVGDSVELPLTAHAYNSGVVITEPTCYSTGLRMFTCTTDGCGDSYTETIAMTSHDYESVVTTEATCYSTGVRTYTCKNEGCGDSYESTISMTSHDYESVVTTEATCYSTGVRTYTCKNEGCGYSYESTISMTSHNYESVITTEPTCQSTGVKTYTCTNEGCGNVRTEIIDAIPHNIVDEVCTECGGEPHYWENSENGSTYYFVQNGTKWISNNKGISSVTASSTWTITVTEDTAYSFEYGVSSENGYDYMTLILDGVTLESEYGGYSGSDTSDSYTNHKTATRILTAGTHTITATYRKDGSVDKGQDSAYIILEPVYFN